jgi:hypothetical protein
VSRRTAASTSSTASADCSHSLRKRSAKVKTGKAVIQASTAATEGITCLGAEGNFSALPTKITVDGGQPFVANAGRRVDSAKADSGEPAT